MFGHRHIFTLYIINSGVHCWTGAWLQEWALVEAGYWTVWAWVDFDLWCWWRRRCGSPSCKQCFTIRSGPRWDATLGTGKDIDSDASPWSRIPLLDISRILDCGLAKWIACPCLVWLEWIIKRIRTPGVCDGECRWSCWRSFTTKQHRLYTNAANLYLSQRFSCGVSELLKSGFKVRRAFNLRRMTQKWVMNADSTFPSLL